MAKPGGMKQGGLCSQGCASLLVSFADACPCLSAQSSASHIPIFVSA